MNFTATMTGMLAAALVSLPAAAGTITGTITDPRGNGLHGVQVRVTGKTAGVSEAVFTNRQGRYELVTRLEGDLAVRARLPYYRDATSSVEVAGRVRVQEDFTLQPMTDPVEISNSLPAAYHFGSLPFETGEDKDFNRWQFQRDCVSCHSLGDPFTRIPRSAEAWVGTIERMHRMVGNFDAALRDRRAVILAAGFTGEPLSVRPEFPVDPALEKAKIYEFPLARAYVPHDAIAHPNGLLYTVDQGLDHIVITDPVTGESRYVPQTDGRAMEYREGFTTADQEVLGEFNPGSRHGPHSLDLAADGKYYVTNTASRSIGVFNPETEQWEPSFVIAEETGAVYPHTIRADSKGDLWFTLAGSEHVGRLNPASGRFDIVDLPHAVSGGVSAGTQPYGVDINPLDDTMWYGRLFADRIGTVDPQTLEVTEYESPVRGPRRMRFDKEGILWVTGFSAGRIARIDVRNGFASKVYDMPEFAPGYRPTPYALGVHPDTQDIWVNEVMTDRIYRFIPAEERWVAYPVPLAGTYSRDMTFTRNGRVCLSNNPIPPPVLEGGVLEVLCIDPAYDPTVEAAVALGQR